MRRIKRKIKITVMDFVRMVILYRIKDGKCEVLEGVGTAKNKLLAERSRISNVFLTNI